MSVEGGAMRVVRRRGGERAARGEVKAAAGTRRLHEIVRGRHVHVF